MTTTEQIRQRLYTIREYFRADFAKRSLAAPAASELIWVLTGEEAMGDEYIHGRYELPVDPVGDFDHLAPAAAVAAPSSNVEVGGHDAS